MKIFYFNTNNSKDRLKEFIQQFEKPIIVESYVKKPIVKIRAGLDRNNFFPSYNMIKQMEDNYIHN